MRSFKTGNIIIAIVIIVTQQAESDAATPQNDGRTQNKAEEHEKNETGRAVKHPEKPDYYSDDVQGSEEEEEED